MAESDASSHKRVKVMVETAERAIVGYVSKPARGDGFRLSDHLNSVDTHFICLSDVEIKDRGQAHRPGEKRPFIAIAINAITFITPLEDD